MSAVLVWGMLFFAVAFVSKQLIDGEIVSRRMNRQVTRSEQPKLFWTIVGLQFAMILCLLGIIMHHYIEGGEY